jgi:transposase-like protein
VSRPPKFNEERAERVLEAIRAGATRRAAAGHAGIDESTLWRWTQRFASFATRLTRAEDDVEVRCTATILHAAADDWRAAAWWLERRRPAEYARHLEPEAIAAGTTTVTVVFDTPLRDDNTLVLDA